MFKKKKKVFRHFREGEKNVNKRHLMRTAPAGLAEERFGGFTAAALSCSLCGVGTRGCE